MFCRRRSYCALPLAIVFGILSGASLVSRFLRVALLVATVACSVPEARGQTPLTAPYPHDRRKNRYISFDPNKPANDGNNIAFKVELKAITLGSCDGSTGGPVDFCRETFGAGDCNACSADGTSCTDAPIDCGGGQTCDPTGETCVNDAPDSGGSNVGRVWWLGPENPPGSGVHVLVSEPFRHVSQDWGSEFDPVRHPGEFVVHAGDCEIVPVAVYGVRAVNVDTAAESGELLVETALFASVSSSWWGDCVGSIRKFCGGDIRTPQCASDADCTAPETCDRSWTLPNGAVNFDDVNAAVMLFAPGPTSVVPDVTWVDVAVQTPDYRVNMSDIGQILHAFSGFPYEYADPADCPSPQPECGNGALEPGEQCDDGNNTAGDGCGAFCQIEGTGERGFEWVPVDSDAPFTLSPNGITIPTDRASIVELELRAEGWGSAPGSPTLGTYQATLDASGLSGSDPTNLLNGTTPGVDLTPLNNQAWRENSGGNGLNDGVFIATRTCHDPALADTGLVCGSLPSSITWDACPGGAPGCIDKDDFVFTGVSSVGAVSTATADFVWGVVGIPGQCTTDDGVTSYYAGTLVLNVPGTAVGTYTIGFDSDPKRSFLSDCSLASIPGVRLIPATITLGGQTCTVPEDCDDANACTNDDCIDGTCKHVANYDTSTECCNPATGGITQIDDGEMCTGDSCDPLTGAVSHGVASGAPDCNANGRVDYCDLACGGGNTCDGIPGSFDCPSGSGNGIPDECEQDCQVAGEPGQGTADTCDLTDGTSVDTNANGVPDECDSGACCYFDTASQTFNCGLTAKRECEVNRGGNFQGIDTECPTEFLVQTIHDGVAVVHITETAQECHVGGGLRTACMPGDPIDPWETAPDAIMCHLFGVGPVSPPIPADFFGPGSDPFTGSVCLEGQPLGPTPFGEFGSADTLVRRTGGPLGNGDPFDRCDLPSATEVQVTAEVVALSLKSTGPIMVTFNGGQNPEAWDVAVDRSVNDPPPGVITAVKTHCNGGTYASALNVQPRFTFTKVSDPGQVRVLDTGLEGIPFITLMQDPGAVWTTDVSDTLPLVSDICTDFHAGVEDVSPTTNCDCNGNTLRDKCDIEAGTATDCNLNAVPDVCDIDSGFSPDGNGNGIPDECDPKPPLTAPFPHDRRKNRYLAFDPNKTQNDGRSIAFKVELKQLVMGSCDGSVGGPTDFCRAGRVPSDCNACSVDGNTCINQQIDCAPVPPQTCDPTGETCVNDAPNAGGTNVGRVWWLGPAQSRCEETAVPCTYGGPSCGRCLNSWSRGCTINDDCGAGGLCVPTDQACIVTHLLVSEADRLVSSDWPNPAYVGDCEIVPEAVYGIRAVNTDSTTESGELLVETTLFATLSSSWWGDCVGSLKKFCGGDIRTPECAGDADCTAPETCDRAWTLPDGSVNFDDVNAALALVAPGANSVAPDVTWVDLHGNASGTPGSQAFDPPNFILNFSDIGQILSGFGGFPYKGYDPADCPNVGTWP